MSNTTLSVTTSCGVTPIVTSEWDIIVGFETLEGVGTRVLTSQDSITLRMTLSDEMR